MSPLVKELLMAVGTDECVASLSSDARDLVGDYDGMAFVQANDDYLRFIGQAGQ